ncbi:hypothetical protein THF1C08_30313 [Vibrio jasicida]|uniref:Uncharacterized protein n=1 Tax=Vibrio jasicida TaxID=766224 RepID=A0AAU9QUG0_9VIBR|nr:hypothetical protein THF1C08_30313 [Vibrio jasicida]CAH1599379.1 hypothetical protein THF1A12_40122 [Vibrio jasicida]
MIHKPLNKRLASYKALKKPPVNENYSIYERISLSSCIELLSFRS